MEVENPSIFDQVLEFGQSAVGAFFDFRARETEADIQRDLLEAERAKLRLIMLQQQGSNANPDAPAPQPQFASSLPAWVLPVVIVTGVGLVGIAVLKS